MKQYIFSAVCLMSGALCMSSCNEDKQAKPYTPDYEMFVRSITCGYLDCL